MPTTGTKRFRTLASRLWACESDCEDLCDSANMPCSRITVAHHLETDGLERKILALERQRLALEKNGRRTQGQTEPGHSSVLWVPSVGYSFGWATWSQNTTLDLKPVGRRQ